MGLRKLSREWAQSFSKMRWPLVVPFWTVQSEFPHSRVEHWSSKSNFGYSILATNVCVTESRSAKGQMGKKKRARLFDDQGRTSRTNVGDNSEKGVGILHGGIQSMRMDWIESNCDGKKAMLEISLAVGWKGKWWGAVLLCGERIIGVEGDVAKRMELRWLREAKGKAICVGTSS